MREILELTLPFEAFLKEGEKYLTYAEQTCIQSMLQGMRKDEDIMRICVKRFEDISLPILDRKLLGAFAGIFEFTMNFVESELGNRGEYDRSDQYSEIIIQGCLRFRRLGALTNSLYNRCWNHTERKRRNMPSSIPQDEKKELYRCILLSRLDKQKNNEVFSEKYWSK